MTAGRPMSGTPAIGGSHFLPCPWNLHPTCLPRTPGSCSKDETLRQWCGMETIRMVHMTEPS